MAQDPNQNRDQASGFGDALALFRRLSSQTVASSFQTQSRDQFGAMVYNRSNATIASLSTPLGANAVASGNRSTAVGAFSNAREDSSVALGVYPQAFGASSIAIGDQSKAKAYRSIAIGTVTTASGVRSIAIGVNSISSGTDSVSIGTTTSASSQSIAIGSGSASGSGDVAIGIGSISSGTNSIALGISSSATGPGTIAIGNRASVTGSATATGAISIGQDAVSTGNHSIAIGELARATHDKSIAFGTSATTSTSNQFIVANTNEPQMISYFGGDVRMFTLGRGLYFKEQAAVGTSATYGRVTLSGAGTAIIYSTNISPTSTIWLAPQNASGTAGAVYISTSTSGVKATVASTNAADTRTVAWLLLESA